MAKKTSKRLPPTPTAVKPVAKATAVEKPAAKKPAAAKAPTPKAAAPKPELCDEQIGYAAGEVWGVLNGAAPMTLAALKKAIDRPAETTLLALGWLAREGKVTFAPSGRSVKVSLK
ncbi:winged helix-turn-helix domain-containing protein [Botrimarina sp.]|uniref:winged helix-turn-helix domain-containing protein n=1 Tax=Botrimarina sp. TaxID=2795802 RepID=UPI0032ED21A2